ncbi:MAG: NfeD family protein [Planctomycetes bacterium]|nr:NfeD family protein [Planctomycetota bacterium]
MTDEQPTTGEHGRAITPMYPSGKVLIDGIEYSARFKSGFADSGDEVIVVGLDAFGLIVGKPEPQES